MKPRRIRVWAIASLVLAVAAAALCLTFLSGGGRGSARGEALPQFTGAPGLMSPDLQIWGMPNRILYSPIDSPRYVSAAEAAAFLEDPDRVYVLGRASGTLVFPEMLLASFHVVNDVVEGEPLAISYCLLSGSVCSFSRKVEDRVLTFGLTGHLYGGNSVLYDKETKTDWLQLNGEPLRGHYFGQARLAGRTLERSTWRRVKGKENLKVLAPNRSMDEYRSFHRDMEPQRLGKKVVESQAKLDPRLLPYTRGLGIIVQGETRFYPEVMHGPRSILQDKVGGWSVVLLREGSTDLSRIFRRRHRDMLLDFDLVDGVLVDRQTSSRWNDDGRSVEGPLAGAQLEIPSYSECYWFVWAALYPGTELDV